MKTSLYYTLVIMAALASSVSAANTENNLAQDLKSANQTRALTESNGRSMDEVSMIEQQQEVKKSPRGGRMLDLDHLSGEISKDEKLTKERLMSGQRQSRILSEDIDTSAKQPQARNKKSKTKKMAIKGFIPIVSLEGTKDGKHLESMMDDSSSDNDNEEEDSPSYQINRDQLLANYGGQTSLGHASFGLQPAANEQQASLAEQEVGRANRKLLAGLSGPRKLVANLMQQQQQQHLMPYALGAAPSNLHQTSWQPGPEQECICVPFFQCKNGFLSESQLSKSQLMQIASQQHQRQPMLHNNFQVPRSLVSPQQQQQQLPSSSDLSSQQHISSFVQPQTEPQQQQVVANDIYEQLRRKIESENLEQQLQQQLLNQQQQQQANFQPLIDERSKLGGRQPDRPVNQTGEADIYERSLLNPLGRRNGQLGGQKCGIMRTCCRIPPNLQTHQVPARHDPRLVQPYPQGYPPQSIPRPQAEYQLLQPMRQPLRPQTIIQSPFELQQPSVQQPDYQMAQHQQQLSQGQQTRPGNFMGGRCGLRPALGISGRVQNELPAPGSESRAEFGEFPAHAAILRRISSGDSLFVCSAALISGQWLATAAHCVRKSSPEQLKVRLGEWDVSRDDEFYPFVEANVREIVIHPDFQPSSLINDLALLRIDPQQGGSMDGAPHISPACLAQPEEQFAGQRCWLAGWGKDAFGSGGTFQSQLHKVDLPVVDRQSCELALRHQTKLGRYFRLHQSALCAGGESGKDACEGDGGAGLYCMEPESGLTKVVGLVSWGVGCGQRGVPGVYTNLGLLSHWIESVVATSGEANLYATDEQLFKSQVSERSNQNSTTTIEQQVAPNNSTQPVEPESS